MSHPTRSERDGHQHHSRAFKTKREGRLAGIRMDHLTNGARAGNQSEEIEMDKSNKRGKAKHAPRVSRPLVNAALPRTEVRLPIKPPGKGQLRNPGKYQ